MIILKYNPRKHKEIIKSLVHALRDGKTVAYPTDTSYGLAADVTKRKALNRVYQIKERGFNKPIHVVVPSVAYAKTLAEWTPVTNHLAKKFWPGALTLVVPVKKKTAYVQRLGSGTGTLGLRMPDNRIALDLAKELGAPITATSANPSAHISKGVDSYKASQVYEQFHGKKFYPDVIVDAGTLPRRKPSTVVRISDGLVKILRPGPITKKQLQAALKKFPVRLTE